MIFTEDTEGNPTTVAWRELTAILALILWSVQLIPQIHKNFQSKSTYGLSPWTFLMWAVANILVASNSFINDVVIPIFIQPQIFGALSLICLTQCYLYPHQNKPRPIWEGGLLFLALLVLFFSIEILWIQFLYYAPMRNEVWFSVLFGYIGPVITSLGFLPQYYDIIKLRSTDGISLMFIFLDLSGGAFALVSLSLHDHFELSVAFMYIAVMSLEFGLLLIHIYYKRFNVLNSLRTEFKRYQRNETSSILISQVNSA